jgi:hypothetical protein
MLARPHLRERKLAWVLSSTGGQERRKGEGEAMKTKSKEQMERSDTVSLQ